MTTTAAQPASDPLTLAAIDTAVKAALVTRGKLKGTLLRRCPDSRSDAAAAWQAIVSHANPHKFSVGMCLLFSARQRAIFDTVDGLIQRQKLDVRHLDRDRSALEAMGAW